jgi:hypothetical protein
MAENKQTIKNLNKLRELIREEIIKENSPNPEPNSGSESGENDKSKVSDSEKQEPIKDADKCLNQIQDLLDWYFGA